jgi:hypothetical protein
MPAEGFEPTIPPIEGPQTIDMLHHAFIHRFLPNNSFSCETPTHNIISTFGHFNSTVRRFASWHTTGILDRQYSSFIPYTRTSRKLPSNHYTYQKASRTRNTIKLHYTDPQSSKLQEIPAQPTTGHQSPALLPVSLSHAHSPSASIYPLTQNPGWRYKPTADASASTAQSINGS